MLSVSLLGDFCIWHDGVPLTKVDTLRLQSLLAYTRQSPDFDCGLSPRAGLALLHSAQAWALMSGRDFALPEDIQTVLPSVVGHRLSFARSLPEQQAASPADQLLSVVAIP